ncbi:MAG: hypothetical protein ACXWG0_04290 [Chthoniobacterales bacterium]
MLETICNCGAIKVARVVLLASGICALTSCATHPEPELVSSGAGRESALPWNKQERWENGGQFGGLADQMSAGGSRR